MEPHPHSTACDISDRLQYIDALGESLEKIQALTRMLILGCSSFGESDNDSHTMLIVRTIHGKRWKVCGNARYKAADERCAYQVIF
jgi:hypothetical protein